MTHKPLDMGHEDCDVCEDARQIEAYRSMWRPIETAPKDGTIIIGWRPMCGQFIGPGTVFWENDGWNTTGDEREIDVDLTHWMPLPPPPEPDGQAPLSD